jgi:hypothetical protein
MTFWQRLKLWFANIAGFLMANPVALIGIGVIVLLILFGYFVQSCNERRREEKKAEINANILKDKIESNILTNEKANINGDVKNASENSNGALGNLDNSVKRDSNSFSGNATDKFCERFCGDSTCAEWRKSHKCP